MRTEIGTALAFLAFIAFTFDAPNVMAQRKNPLKVNPDQPLSDRIDRIRSSVVRIEVSFEDGGQSSGSGFIVNKDGDVVTAYHLLTMGGRRTSAEIEKPGILVKMPIPATHYHGVSLIQTFTAASAKVVARDLAHDIAILAAPGIMTPSFKPLRIGHKDIGNKVQPARMVASPIRDGEPVFVSGYPLNSPTLITTSGFVASSMATEVDTTNGKLLDTYWLDIQANPGNSGGPVFSLHTGYVIAIQVEVQTTPLRYLDGAKEDVKLPTFDSEGKVTGSRQVGYNAGIAGAVPAEYIQDLLIKNGRKLF